MMKRRLLDLMLLGVFVFGCTPDQSSLPEPDRIFIKYYGGAKSDEAADFLVDDDGDLRYVIFAASNSQEIVGERGESNTDFVLIFADKAGNQINSIRSYFPDTGGESVVCKPKRIIKATAGGFVMAGTIEYSGQSDMFVAKVDADGNLIGTPWFNNSTQVEVANDIVEVSDGFLVVGSTGTGNSKEALMVKLGFNVEEVIWTKADGYVDVSDEGISLVPTQNGNRALMIVNTNQPIDGEGGVSNGNLAVYDFETNTTQAPNPALLGLLGLDELNEVAVRVRKISDSEFYLIGNSVGVNSTLTKPFFLRFITSSSSANIVADNIFDDLAGVTVEDISRNVTGDFLIVGSGVVNLSNGLQMLLCKLDPFGVLDIGFGNGGSGFPAYQFGSLGDETGAAVSELPDGGIGLLGTIALDNNANTLIGFIKTNRNGVLRK
ncbi:MAG: hypothetical protein RIB86_09225 [Imperialibacter sp.]